LGDPGGLPNEMYGFIKLFQEVMWTYLKPYVKDFLYEIYFPT
jgi:hypothetical protein